MNKKLIALLACAAFATSANSFAQESLSPDPTSALPVAPPPPQTTEEKLEAESTVPPQPDPKAERWRSEVLAWKNARRVEEGTESGSIRELSERVLILGTVNGDVSTVSGDVAVVGEVNGNVSSVSGTITVLGTVDGKASVVGGNLRVAGKVTGDASVVGGKLDTAPGGEVLGNSNSVGSSVNFDFRRHGDWKDKFDRDGGGFIKAFWFSPFMLIWRSALLILWVALSCAMAALFEPAILRAQEELRNAPARCVAFGFLWKIVFWMLFVGCIVLALMFIGLPLLVVLIAFDLAVSAFGMTLVFSMVGEGLARRLNHPNASLYATVFAGACLLGVLRLIPIFGSLIWFIAGLFGTGAALAARFGIEPTPPARPITLPPSVPA